MEEEYLLRNMFLFKLIAIPLYVHTVIRQMKRCLVCVAPGVLYYLIVIVLSLSSEKRHLMHDK